MVYPIYCINDALVGFQQPVMQNNDAFAMRAFKEAFEDSKNPQDYSLWFIGEFDTDTGEIVPSTPSVICRGTDISKEIKEK